MSRAGREFLASRVARRIFALFVVSALVPLALIVLLSMTHVRGVLIEQGERRLAVDAKTYVASAYGRLLDAADVAGLAVESWSGPQKSPLVLQAFDGLARLAPDGRITHLTGRAIEVVPTAAERARLESGHRVLRAIGDGDAARRIVVIVPLADRSAQGFALAAVRDEYLWGDRDAWPDSVEFCVYDSSTLASMHCPAASPGEAARRATGGAPAAARSFAWQHEGTAMRSVAWDQFLHAEFGAEDWIVVASQPEDDLLRSAEAFRAVFVPVSVLALLAVVWLSLRLIRGTLTPLERLTEATRRVAVHDFDSSVEVDRADEFGELARAFNAMARRLGRQFKALNTLAAIDREILSSHSVEHVMRAVLQHMGMLVPSRAVAVVLIDHRDRKRAHASIAHAGGAGDIATLDATLTDAERAELQREPAGTWITAASNYPECVKAIFGADVAAAYAHPIAWRDELCGSLVFGFAERIRLLDEEQKQIRELAARLAVAISSAWRDAQLYSQAHYDSLTGLPNRLLFGDRLAQQVARCERDATRFALLFIDLDHFKSVNDTQGHSRGDMVLCEAARRLERCVRASDTVARLGGDEFAIMLTDLTRSREVDRVVRQIMAGLSRPFVLDGQQSYLGASVGVAIFPADGRSAEVLLRNADTAMYRAKANGRAQVAFYEERMNREARERVLLDRELRLALDRDELELYYQPQIELRSGRIVAAEALIRWNHPERGLVMPDRFIPVAEESDLIEDIGRWVIREACRNARELRAQGVVLDRLAANASARELHHADFVSYVRKTLREHGLEPSLLEIEVTESLLVQRVAEVRRVLNDLKAAGLTVALDDFGVGFASMASLRDFPFDIVKIDKSFVVGLPDCAHSSAIVTATIAVSRALGKKVIAEGVETEAQLAVLRELGCDYAQGHFIARPMAAAEFARHMLAHGGRRSAVPEAEAACDRVP